MRYLLRLAPAFLPLLFLLPLPSLADDRPEPPITADERNHWAFKKPQRTEPPRPSEPAWVRNPVDAFLLARLEKEGLRPAPLADRATLLRRVTTDLTGLPPTIDELDAFLRDERPEAYERVVDRLLASPQFGERWAQHWLDVVRYAESNGYEADAERPHAWRYRDWVVKAFNGDMPFDRFVKEQLAGDLLARAKGTPKDNPDLLIATGLHRCGSVHMVGGNLDADVLRQEMLTEMTSAVGQAFLGLTLGCARCHDHKFDPVSQVDYYRLQAFFSATQPKDYDFSTAEQRDERDRRVKEFNAKIAPLRAKVAGLEGPCRTRLIEAKKKILEPEYREALDIEAAKRTPEQHKLAMHAEILIKVTWDEIVAALSPEDRERRVALREQIHALEGQFPLPVPHAWAVNDVRPVPPTYLLKRGDPKNKGGRVEAGFLRVLGPPSEPAGDRLALAKWLTSPEHPLTARVIVNRLWQHHFGRGLVATPNDFGIRGDVPTHPELLDWLATELVANGWSLKHLHRLILLSNAYRQESRTVATERARKVDPENRLLWRANRRRLEAEAVRDAMLASAGTLNPKVGGPMVRVPLEPEVYDLIFTEGDPDGLWRVTPDSTEHTRRSLYLFAKRNVRQPLFEAFDQPDTLTSCPVRPVSTFAPQALILLNGPLAQEQSKAFAARLLKECSTDTVKGVERAYRLALGRSPRPEEVKQATDFLAEQTELLRARLRARMPVRLPREVPAGIDPALAGALADFCLAMFNRNEFVYVR
jgi:hypothetical protein